MDISKELVKLSHYLSKDTEDNCFYSNKKDIETSKFKNAVYFLCRYVEGDLNALDSKNARLLASNFSVKKGTELYRGTNTKEPNRVVQSWSKSERFAKLYAKDKNGVISKMVVKSEKTIDVVRVFRKFNWYGNLLTIDELFKAEEVIVVL